MKTEKDYELYLNEVYGNIKICGMEYPAGQILRAVDEIAFDVGYAGWSSSFEDESCETCPYYCVEDDICDSPFDCLNKGITDEDS